jgi:zinc transport system substrate-binding protein
LDLEPADHDGHDHESEGDHSGHDHGDLDPHFWLDPLRMADLADEVARALGEADPKHADEYAARAADLRTDLVKLDQSYEQRLSSCERSTVVVSHDAFGYLSKYGLDMEPIAGLSPGAEPTPADLARLQDLIESEGITTVFSERLVSPRVSQSLADDVGVETAVLDPIEGLSDDTGDEDYLSLMEENLAALEKANGCS